MDIENIKCLSIFCNQYYMLNHFKYSSDEIINVYKDYMKNYYNDIDAYKDLFGKNSNTKISYEIIDNFNKQSILNNDNKILFLNLSTYYQSYFFELENSLKDNIYHLFYEGENHNQFLKKVKEKHVLNMDKWKTVTEKRSLFGIKGMKQFISNKNVRFLRLNFDGGYFNKYFSLFINNGLSLKLASGLVKLGYLAKADVVSCFWVKNNNNDMILKLQPLIRYTDDFHKYQLSVHNSLKKCIIDFFNNFYPSQWIRWRSIHTQFDLNNTDYESVIGNNKSILIECYNEKYLFDSRKYDIFKVNESQYDRLKKNVDIGGIYNITI